MPSGQVCWCSELLIAQGTNRGPNINLKFDSICMAVGVSKLSNKSKIFKSLLIIKKAINLNDMMDNIFKRKIIYPIKLKSHYQ